LNSSTLLALFTCTETIFMQKIPDDLLYTSTGHGGVAWDKNAFYTVQVL